MLCFLVNPGRHSSQLRPIVWSLSLKKWDLWFKKVWSLVGACIDCSYLESYQILSSSYYANEIQLCIKETRCLFVGSDRRDSATHCILMKLKPQLKFSIWIEFECLWWIKFSDCLCSVTFLSHILKIPKFHLQPRQSPVSGSQVVDFPAQQMSQTISIKISISYSHKSKGS